MTAIDQAASMIRSGRSPALAVCVTAQQFGLTTAEVSRGLAQRRRARKLEIVARRSVRRWWED